MNAQLEGWQQAWAKFHGSYDGAFSPGPFGKLMQLAQTLNWHIDSNFQACTPHGLMFSLTESPWPVVEMIFHQAWWQIQSGKLSHRADFAGLDGFCAQITNDLGRLATIADQELLHTCQDGTFYTETSKQHWDLTRMGTCKHCGQMDTLEHRLRACPQHAELRERFGRLHRLWDSLPHCMTMHGLCPQVPWQISFWKELLQLPDLTLDHQQVVPRSSSCHLFTDGACKYNGEAFALASWAVVMDGMVLSAGPLHGILQTVPRAELTAFCSALAWAINFPGRVHIWTDSQYVHDGFVNVQEGVLDDQADNHDLWSQVSSLYERATQPIEVHKIWSHMDPTWAPGPLETWWIAGNAHADAAAQIANESRSADFMQIWTKFRRSWHLEKRNVRDSQDFLLAIAKAHGTITSEEALENMPLSALVTTRPTEPNEHLFSDAFSSRLPAELCFSPVALRFGTEVVGSIFRWLTFLDDVATDSMSVSFLELYLGWLLSTTQRLPIQDPSTKRWVAETHMLAGSFPQSLANRLSVFRGIVVGVCSDLSVALQFEQVDLRDYHVYRRVPGIRLGMPHFVHGKILTVIRELFKVTPWRRQTDVAMEVNLKPDPQVQGLLESP